MALWGGMGDDKTYTTASKVTAKDGDVVLDGPDGVDVKLTPDAAIETSDQLLTTAAKAQGQRVMKGFRKALPIAR